MPPRWPVQIRRPCALDQFFSFRFVGFTRPRKVRSMTLFESQRRRGAVERYDSGGLCESGERHRSRLSRPPLPPSGMSVFDREPRAQRSTTPLHLRKDLPRSSDRCPVSLLITPLVVATSKLAFGQFRGPRAPLWGATRSLTSVQVAIRTFIQGSPSKRGGSWSLAVRVWVAAPGVGGPSGVGGSRQAFSLCRKDQ